MGILPILHQGSLDSLFEQHLFLQDAQELGEVRRVVPTDEIDT